MKKFLNVYYVGALADFATRPRSKSLLADFGQKITARGPLFPPPRVTAS